MDVSTLASLLARGGSGPLYRRLADLLHQAVRTGELGPGTRLPSERDLASKLNISRTTVIGAYRLLREAGLLTGERGGGTRVVAADRLGSAVPASTIVATRLTGADLPGVVDLTVTPIAGDTDLLPILSRIGLVDLESALFVSTRYQPLGLAVLRERIAARHTARGCPTDPSEILVTNGAQQAIALTFALFGRDGGRVLAESSTYFGAVDAARALGIPLDAIPVDEHGIRVAALRAALKRTKPTLLYMMSQVQNPTGTVLNSVRRGAIVRAAHAAGVAVLDDEAMAELTFDASTADPARDIPDVVVGSLAKVCWPGLRIGWIRARADIMVKLARMKAVADLGTSVPSQLLAIRLLDLLDEVAAVRRRQLVTRLELAATLLAEHLPEWTLRRPGGGMFLWVRLPRGDAETFAEAALLHGVRVLAGNRTSIDGGHDHLRLSFGVEPSQLREGIHRLASAWRAMQAGHPADRMSLRPTV